MLDYFEREQLPGDVKTTLASALYGDPHLQGLLFTAMLDTWPRLQKAISEMTRAVSIAPWKITPHAERGEKPTPEAEAIAKEIESLVWGMRPRAASGEAGLEGTIRNIALGYYCGHSVSEIRWEKNQAGAWAPRGTKLLPARFYGYENSGLYRNELDDRLMLNPGGRTGSRDYVDFPEHRCLIAIHSGNGGHAASGAPLRALAGYWLAAIYGLKWFLNFTQLYGIPWRHAEVSNERDFNSVKKALDEIGSTGRIVTNAGAKINILSAPSTSGSLPQKELIDLADRQCDQFILSSTLTSGTDGSGSRALGDVHADSKQAAIDGLADFVGEVLTSQFIPSIIAVNWGPGRSDLPQMWAKREEVIDEKAKADRMKILSDIGIPVGKVWAYEDLGIPAPAAGEELFFTPLQVSPNLTPASNARAVSAVNAAEKSTVDQLSESVLEGLTGVSEQWLAPVKPIFERLAALAMSKKVTDSDFVAALEKAHREMPEIFDLLDAEALQTAFENAIGSAALAGSTSAFEK